MKPVDVDRLLAGELPAFALLHRPHSPAGGGVDLLTGDVLEVPTLADLPQVRRKAGAGHDLLALIPFRQIAERGFDCVDDGTPLVALNVTGQSTITVAEALAGIPDEPVAVTGGEFDIDDESYAAIVRRVLADEIGRGAGANFVIKRSFAARLDDYTPRTALTIFRRLLEGETGAYWTFLIHTGDRTLVGATPERHVSSVGGRVVMNPISGTYRYPEEGPDPAGLLDFLADQKEIDELYMVVDEELKMMGRVCAEGGRVTGPYLREMARVAHTEYLLDGHSDLRATDILRETMFAPTVTGSPLENACRVISRYEPVGRGYYSGVVALLGTDGNNRPTLDSAIVIRTAEIGPTGRMTVGVGATLVRHSDPDSEVAETRAKAAGVLGAIRGERLSKRDAGLPARLGADLAVRAAVAGRNTQLATFWLTPPQGRHQPVDELLGRRVLVVDAEDTFTAMLAHQLRALGLDITIRGHHEPIDHEGFDAVLVGPGPGDPRDGDSIKIGALRRITDALLRDRKPFVSVCLGHQVLSGLLGLSLRRRDEPNQGARLEIELFGRRTVVGFYNTFVAWSPHDVVDSPGYGVSVRVSRDRATGEVYALRAPWFASMQFHAESILTEDGPAILAEAFAAVLAHAPVLDPTI
ncbi:chorismate-binding protein [Actinokineospora xionganensis]|uniref:anthranilate synthase n=1 Tax=Actinokineospora xionganensis TaxID=2684470 RepID=A0ABR7KZX2_9PSEU|nr:chorismate-binding protein [Actinokineospora xionganensis]MBC6445981.1 phenazine-specific anthranilate synthase [Actinokineospora xionganensis]